MLQRAEYGVTSSAHRLRKIVWGAAAILLLLPLVAMQFTDQVAWTGVDFAVFGVMLAITGAGIELTLRVTDRAAYRAGACIALAAAFFLVWVNGAVGIIGNENNPANLMYGGVLAVAVLGAMVARFRPPGLARAMVAAAIAQVLVLAVALFAVPGAEGPKWPLDAIFLTVFFVALWLVAAWLFHHGAGTTGPARK